MVQLTSFVSLVLVLLTSPVALAHTAHYREFSCTLMDPNHSASKFGNTIRVGYEMNGVGFFGGVHWPFTFISPELGATESRVNQSADWQPLEASIQLGGVKADILLCGRAIQYPNFLMFNRVIVRDKKEHGYGIVYECGDPATTPSNNWGSCPPAPWETPLCSEIKDQIENLNLSPEGTVCLSTDTGPGSVFPATLLKRYRNPVSRALGWKDSNPDGSGIVWYDAVLPAASQPDALAACARRPGERLPTPEEFNSAYQRGISVIFPYPDFREFPSKWDDYASIRYWTNGIVASDPRYGNYAHFDGASERDNYELRIRPLPAYCISN